MKTPSMKTPSMKSISVEGRCLEAEEEARRWKCGRPCIDFVGDTMPFLRVWPTLGYCMGMGMEEEEEVTPRAPVLTVRSIGGRCVVGSSLSSWKCSCL